MEFMRSSSPQPPPLFVPQGGLDQRDSVQLCCKQDQHGGTTTIWIDTALGHRCESPTLDAKQPPSCARPDTPAEEDLDAARCLSTNTVRARGSPEQQQQFDDSISLWMLPLCDDRDANLEPVQQQLENGTAPLEHGCTRFPETEASDDEYSDNFPRRAPLKRRLWTLSAPSAENPNKSRKF